MTTRLWPIAALIALGVGCGASTTEQTTTTTTPTPTPAPAPTPSPTPAPDPGPPPTQTTPPPQAGCTGPAPGPGYECVRHCGPPVVRSGDPPPGWGWMSAADAERRRQYGCPVCLPADTRIATPDGERAVSSLRVGDPIWTRDRSGQRVAARVLYAGSTPISGSHHVVRVTLADGRAVAASAGHPTVSGTPMSELRPGDPLSGSVVLRTELTPMAGEHTFDVLPSGPTGEYWADGVELRSSFVR